MNTKAYDEMILTGITNPTDTKRLVNQLRDSTECNMWFLGGSITYGLSLSAPHTPFPTLLCQKLNRSKRFHRQFIPHNYGYCCFHTHLGISVLDEQLQLAIPDLVCLEYAVNNNFDADNIASFEGMIQKILQANPKAAIIILCSCDENGYSCENYMAEIAAFYSLPLISVAKILESGKSTGFLWHDYSPDNCHPSQKGQQLLADAIYQLFESTQLHSESFLESTVIPTAYCFRDTFAHAHYLPASSSDAYPGMTVPHDQPFSQRLILTAADHTTSLRLRFHCRALYLLYEQTCEPSCAGQITLQIPALKSKITVNGYSIYGWNNPCVSLIFESEPDTYEITVSLSDLVHSRSFTIYGYLLLL